MVVIVCRLADRDRQTDRLHISQFRINLVVEESPLVANELALQFLLRKGLELLLGNGVQVNFGEALANGVCDAFVSGATGLEAGELVGGTWVGSCGATVGGESALVGLVCTELLVLLHWRRGSSELD
jgi:hypothetical protein